MLLGHVIVVSVLVSVLCCSRGHIKEEGLSIFLSAAIGNDSQPVLTLCEVSQDQWTLTCIIHEQYYANSSLILPV